jgi:rhodanese-related sulfurtransferase
MAVSKRSALIIFAVVAVVAIAAGLYTPKLLNRNNDDYRDVSVMVALELIDENPDLVIVDVRTVTEFDDGHIDGAINIPVEEIGDKLDELDKDDELLVYCRTGNRSGRAVGILKDAGYTRIYHMHEGISVWIQQGYPVVQ